MKPPLMMAKPITLGRVLARPSAAGIGERSDQIERAGLPSGFDRFVDVANCFARALPAVSDLSQAAQASGAVRATRPCHVERLAQYAFCVCEGAGASQRRAELAAEDQNSAQRVIELSA